MFYIFFSRLSQLAFDCSDMFLSGLLISWQKAENGSNKSHQCSIQILIIVIIDFSNVSLPYALWLYNILDTKNSPVECTDVLKSDLYERSVWRQTTCLLLLMKGEVKKHVYKDLRNKTQHLCAFFPSCNSSYINFVANLLFRRKLEAVV